MKAIWMTVAIALSLSTVACGGAAGKCKSMCKDRAECKDTDPAYVADAGDCEEDCDSAFDEADGADCKSEYSDLVSCGKKNFSCDGADFVKECKSEIEATDKCAAE
jgi:hypothetical protein